MAEALCGPSNPLQNFRKHTSADRSLQQDRIISRQTPATEFRSSSSLNAGALDAEFEAFQAGFSPGLQLPQPPQQPSRPYIQPNRPAALGQPSTPAWALDFQRMNISKPQSAVPVPQPQSFGQFSGWHQEFQRRGQNASSSTPHSTTQNQYQPRFSNLAQFSAPNSSFLHQYTPPNITGQTSPHTSLDHTANQFDDAAFSKAFSEHDLAEAVTRIPQAEAASSNQHQDPLIRTTSVSDEAALLDDGSSLKDIMSRIAKLQKEGDEIMSRIQASDARLEQTQIRNQEEMERRAQALKEYEADWKESTPGETRLQRMERLQHNLQNLEKSMMPSPPPPAQDEELANIAEQLLDRVADNYSDKFQKSGFLRFMRQVRDGDVRVDGDKFVYTNSTSDPYVSVSDPPAPSAHPYASEDTQFINDLQSQ